MVAARWGGGCLSFSRGLLDVDRDARLRDFIGYLDDYRETCASARVRRDADVHLKHAFNQRWRGTGVGDVGGLDAVDEDSDGEIEIRHGRAYSGDSAGAAGRRGLSSSAAVNIDELAGECAISLPVQ